MNIEKVVILQEKKVQILQGYDCYKNIVWHDRNEKVTYYWDFFFSEN